MNRLELREKDNGIGDVIRHQLDERIIGQDEAKRVISTALSNMLNPLFDKTGTLGNFFFYGKTGVGKSETCKAISDIVLGLKGHATIINCEQLQQSHEYSKMFGAPPGYIGYGDKTLLHPKNLFAGYRQASKSKGNDKNRMLRRLPNFCVIVLDEFEKAHPKVKQSVLGMMEEGEVTLGNGTYVNLSNAIIIATSNVGESGFTRGVGFNVNNKELKDEHRKNAINDAFSPELRGRFDEFVQFDDLTEEDSREFIKSKDRELMESVGYIMPNILVKVDPSVYDFCLDNYNKDAGIRGLSKFRDKHVKFKVGRVLQTNDMSTFDGYNVIIDGVEEGGEIRFYINSDGIIKNVKKQLEENLGKKGKHDKNDKRGSTKIGDLVDLEDIKSRLDG